MADIPDPWFDPEGMFVLSPSYMLATLIESSGERLDEGKMLGKAKEADLALSHDLTIKATIDPEKYASDRKIGVTVGRRKLIVVQTESEKALNELVDDYTGGKLLPKELREEVTKVMRRAWKDVYVAGIRSSGVPGTGQGNALQVGPEDQAFLKGAVSHEMRYLNNFITSIVEETGKMPTPRRVKMYVDALTSFYENARVAALPATTTIRWAGPEDNVTCPSCDYLFRNNLYTKKTLPTVPRSGATVCLTNCRDRLLVRRVDSKTVLETTHGGKTREQHVGALARIKQGKKVK